MARRTARVLAAVVLAVPIAWAAGIAGISPGPRLAHAKSTKVLDVPLPPGSRSAAEHLFHSRRGFRETVEFYQRFLRRAGLRHEAVPVYRARGTDVARFLSRHASSSWAAIHVFRHEGRTMIYIVPKQVLTAAETQGKEASP